MSRFERSQKRIENVIETNKLNQSKIKFGITFLDDAFGGIFPDDLVVMTARTGAGKTELATQLAYHNAKGGFSVHLFALEAYDGEIETRILYRKLTERFFKETIKNGSQFPNFQDWVYNKQQDILGHFEPEALVTCQIELQNLYTYYRDKQFNIDNFEASLAQIGESTDLVIVDHLHYFDLESKEENVDLKRTVKKIRDLTLFYRKPTVLVAHIRKQDKRFNTIVPDIEDIYGSSDITKVATKIFAVAPAINIGQSQSHIFPTYIRILKNRLDGSRSYHTAICKFNIQKNCYEDEYCLGKVDSEGDFKEAEHGAIPKWAKHHRSNLSKHSEGPPNSFHDKDAW